MFLVGFAFFSFYLAQNDQIHFSVNKYAPTTSKKAKINFISPLEVIQIQTSPSRGSQTLLQFRIACGAIKILMPSPPATQLNPKVWDPNQASIVFKDPQVIPLCILSTTGLLIIKLIELLVIKEKNKCLSCPKYRLYFWITK